jgi:hypothetical protein
LLFQFGFLLFVAWVFAVQFGFLLIWVFAVRRLGLWDFVRRLGFCCSLQCSSPSSFVIAGGEDCEVRERERKRGVRDRDVGERTSFF